MKSLSNFLRSEDAATAVEYAVMLALILVGIIGTISAVGTQNGGLWSNNVNEIQNAMTAP